MKIKQLAFFYWFAVNPIGYARYYRFEANHPHMKHETQAQQQISLHQKIQNTLATLHCLFDLLSPVRGSRNCAKKKRKTLFSQLHVHAGMHRHTRATPEPHQSAFRSSQPASTGITHADSIEDEQ